MGWRWSGDEETKVQEESVMDNRSRYRHRIDP
jgi:hypothetical protein